MWWAVVLLCFLFLLGRADAFAKSVAGSRAARRKGQKKPKQSTTTSSVSTSSANRSGGGGFGFDKKYSKDISHTPDPSSTTRVLVDWLTSHKAEGIGPSTSSPQGTEIGVDTNTQMRGLFTTKSFRKGEILCKIPSGCVLGLQDPSKMGGDASTLPHAARNLMQWYLSEEKWKPYTDTLPSKDNIDETPDFYSKEEFDLLEFPKAIELVQQRLDEMDALLKEDDQLTREDLQYATWLVSSRSFRVRMHVEGEEDKSEIAKDESGRDIAQRMILSSNLKYIQLLIPYIDMVNHRCDSNCELDLLDPNEDDGWFCLRATKPILSNEEVTMTYGSTATSLELLVNFGFVPSENKFDAMLLKRGGEGCIANLEGWTTTLEEDEAMLQELEGGTTEDDHLRKILSFRVRLKRAYGEIPKK